MTPEAELYLAKARRILDHARTMLTVDLTEDAGRAAYLAGYHAAEALIFERTGRVTKTHKGAHLAFARLVTLETVFDVSLRPFLARAYDLKAICDYELGPDAIIPREAAEAAVAEAARFVAHIADLLGGPPNA